MKMCAYGASAIKIPSIQHINGIMRLSQKGVVAGIWLMLRMVDSGDLLVLCLNLTKKEIL